MKISGQLETEVPVLRGGHCGGLEGKDEKKGNALGLWAKAIETREGNQP